MLKNNEEGKNALDVAAHRAVSSLLEEVVDVARTYGALLHHGVSRAEAPSPRNTPGPWPRACARHLAGGVPDACPPGFARPGARLKNDRRRVLERARSARMPQAHAPGATGGRQVPSVIWKFIQEIKDWPPGRDTAAGRSGRRQRGGRARRQWGLWVGGGGGG